MSKTRKLYIGIPGGRFSEIEISATDKIGSGAFALVFRAKVSSKDQAIKVWKKLSPEMAKKLEYLVTNQGKWGFGENVYIAKYCSMDTPKDGINGMSMDLLDKRAEEMGTLFNKRHWARLQMNHSKVATLFANGFQDLESFGKKNFVVVDISGRNVLFVPQTLIPEWIDFDSWRIVGMDFGEPFMYTQEFIDPLLVDPRYTVTGKKPNPTPANDLATFGRLFVRSFFGVDVYGGTHATISSEEDRISSRIWFLDSEVKLPSFAAHPYQASDEILHALHQTYVEDKRDVLKSSMFKSLGQEMQQCPICNNWHARQACPICTQVVPQPIKPMLIDSITVKQLIQSIGTIETARFYKGVLLVVAYENNKVVVYKKGKDGNAIKIDLFDSRPALRFEFVGLNLLAVNEGASNKIELWDISGSHATIFETTTSEPYASGRNRSPFRGSGENLIRLAQRAMKKGAIEYGTLFVERNLPIQTSLNQTWFWSHPTEDVHLVFLNLLLDPENLTEKHEYALIVRDQRYDLTLPALNEQETLLDASVRFGTYSAVYRRITEKGRKKFLRTDVIGYDGKVRLSNVVNHKDHPSPIIRGYGYSDVDELGNESEPIIWHPTDNGMAKEFLDASKYSPLKPTQGAVTAADAVVHISSRGKKRHFLVIRASSVDYLILNS